jgi:hypothetical protein
MTVKFTTRLVAATLTLFAAVAFAQDGKTPKMTPEQMAEMEAYTKAGTPVRRTSKWRQPPATTT